MFRREINVGKAKRLSDKSRSADCGSFVTRTDSKRLANDGGEPSPSQTVGGKPVTSEMNLALSGISIFSFFFMFAHSYCHFFPPVFIVIVTFRPTLVSFLRNANHPAIAECP